MNKYIPLILSLSIICTTVTAMDDELLEQTTQQPSVQDQMKALISKKNTFDLTYTGLVVGMAAANLYNAIWEEPTLESDYVGAYTLSIGNRINTALSLSIGLADMIWLLKPYCTSSYETSQITSWAEGMGATHLVAGHTKSVVASLIALGGGIRRYPRTLGMLTANALVDFVGYINADNHNNVAQEINDNDLGNESL